MGVTVNGFLLFASRFNMGLSYIVIRLFSCKISGDIVSSLNVIVVFLKIANAQISLFL